VTTFIHIEPASETSPTFPIEIYLSSGDGGSGGWLINPRSIERWRDWPKPFLAEHHITSADLETYGTAPVRVCEELAARPFPGPVHSLEPERHGALLHELFSAALGVESPVVIADARSMFISILSRVPKSAIDPEELLDQIFEEVAKTRPAVRGGAFEIPFLHAVEARCASNDPLVR
jgi:hypothetical protein